jgi:hypothetical protein
VLLLAHSSLRQSVRTHMQPLGIRCSVVLQSGISIAMNMFSRELLVLCLCLCGNAHVLLCEQLQRDVSELAHVFAFSQVLKCRALLQYWRHEGLCCNNKPLSMWVSLHTARETSSLASQGKQRVLACVVSALRCCLAVQHRTVLHQERIAQHAHAVRRLPIIPVAKMIKANRLSYW